MPLRLKKSFLGLAALGLLAACGIENNDQAPLPISFEWLASFQYDLPEDLTEEIPGEAAGTSSRIPEEIRSLNRTKIALKGFMLPLKVEEGLVTELLIMRDQSMCCYGTVPEINEWVSVKMEGKGVKAVMDQAVTMFGKLHVGEIREQGYLVGIYEMDGYRMDGPEDTPNPPLNQAKQKGETQ